jgi:hypothetical protein
MAAKKKVTRLTNVTPSKEEKAVTRASDAARSKKTSAVRAGKTAKSTSLSDVAIASATEDAIQEKHFSELKKSRTDDEYLFGSEDTSAKRGRELTFKGLGQKKKDMESGKSVAAAHDDIAARIPTTKTPDITSVVRDPWGSGNPVVSQGTGMAPYTSRQGTSYGQSDEDTHRRLLRTAKDAHPRELGTVKRLLSAHLEKTHAYGLPSLCEGPTCRNEIPFESDQDYCAGDSCKTETQRSTPTPRSRV